MDQKHISLSICDYNRNNVCDASLVERHGVHHPLGQTHGLIKDAIIKIPENRLSPAVLPFLLMLFAGLYLSGRTILAKNFLAVTEEPEHDVSFHVGTDL